MKQPYSRASKVARVIKGAMLRRGIESQKELSEFTGMGEKQVSDRMNGKVWWDILDLWKLDAALHFTDDEWVRIKELPFIFDRFYKADKAHTSGMGTGLGLSIVKKILEQHGQTIRCQSGLNGTEFLFTLDPAEDKKPGRREDETSLQAFTVSDPN